jgi:hypothetical protein
VTGARIGLQATRKICFLEQNKKFSVRETAAPFWESSETKWLVIYRVQRTASTAQNFTSRLPVQVSCYNNRGSNSCECRCYYVPMNTHSVSLLAHISRVVLPSQLLLLHDSKLQHRLFAVLSLYD